MLFKKIINFNKTIKLDAISQKIITISKIDKDLL